MIDQTLAHFHVTDKLGEGGMGTVFRAQDTKLGRDVALKLLPDAFANDAARMARFTREAQLLASLNHPNIAGIHAVEEAPHPDSGQPVHFLVMELVEGETLQERIERGQLSFDEALKITLQIATGLEEAHERGIIHRDLKPANVKLTPDKQVKILDFGLAKAFDPDAGSDSLPPSILQSVAFAYDDANGDAGGNVARHCVVHESGASPRRDGRSTRRYLGAGCRADGDVDRKDRAPREDRLRYIGFGARARTRLG